jgi:hypothetical protein
MTAVLLPVRHTARAVSWTALGGAVVLLLAVGTVVVLSGAPTDPLLALAAATVAAGALAGLHDPAAALLSAVPTSAGRRRVHRLALLVPVAAVAWTGLLAAARLDDGWSAGWPMGPLVALLVTGIAVATWAPEGWAVPAAVAVPPAWAVLDRLLGQSDGIGGWFADDVLSVWVVHPWAVVVLAGAAAVVGWRR